MTNKQERLVEFLTQYLAPNIDPWAYTTFVYSTKSGDEVAQELLHSFEFRALRLGTWLGTTEEGIDIVSAVEQVLPPSYRLEVTLIVDALRLAAKLQAEEENRYAVGVISIVGGASLVVLLACMMGRSVRPPTV